jgi:hypothetical protein
MIAHDRRHVGIFDVAGETAYAWYFVMAHWPDPATVPQLRSDVGPPQLIFDPTPEVFDKLRRTLNLALAAGGSVAESASLLLRQIKHVLPQDEAPPKDSSMAGWDITAPAPG